MNKRYIVGLGIIAVCGVVALFAFKGSVTPYVGFAEAKTLGRSCQVMGEIDKEKVHYDVANAALHFNIIDDSGLVMPVVYHGVTPGNFDQAKDVVCSGQYDDGTFVAERLLVKCPSKYQGLEAEGEENPHASPIQEDGV